MPDHTASEKIAVIDRELAAQVRGQSVSLCKERPLRLAGSFQGRP